MSETPRELALGNAFAVTSEDPEWTGKVLTVGACMLIPLVGPFQALGYRRRVFLHAQAGGQGLPAPALGEDIVEGFKTALVTMLNVLPMSLALVGCFFGCTFVPTLVVAGGAAATGMDSDNPLPGLLILVSSLGGYAVLFIGALLLGVLQVDLGRRIYNGEMMPILSPGASIRAVKKNPGAFMMTWLGMLGAGFLGGIGVILCYIGALFTMPLGYSIAARVLAQWDAIVKAGESDEPLYG